MGDGALLSPLLVEVTGRDAQGGQQPACSCPARSAEPAETARSSQECAVPHTPEGATACGHEGSCGSHVRQACQHRDICYQGLSGCQSQTLCRVLRKSIGDFLCHFHICIHSKPVSLYPAWERPLVELPVFKAQPKGRLFQEACVNLVRAQATVPLLSSSGPFSCTCYFTCQTPS